MKQVNLAAVGKRIKKARKSLKLQQQEMAAAMGISPSHLSEIESGKANPGTDIHIKLANLYNISVEYIIRGQGQMLYDTDSKITDEPFDLKSDVDTLDKLNSLLKHSGYFRNAIFAYASKFIIQEESLIEKSIEKNRLV